MDSTSQKYSSIDRSAKTLHTETDNISYDTSKDSSIRTADDDGKQGMFTPELTTLVESPVISNPSLNKMSPLQKKFYYFFQDPTGIYARMFQGMSYVLLLLFTIMFLIESLPQFTDRDGRTTLFYIFFPLETLITIWWMIELCGRFYASVDKLKFFSKFSNIVDLMTILPYFLLFIENRTATDIARVLRLLRLVKILQLTRYSVGVQMAAKAMRRSWEAIITLFMFLIASTLLASSLIFWAERGEWNGVERYWMRADGQKSSYQSIPEGFYWAMVTLSTVGYGDVTPITPLGKFIACLTMVISILTIALPTSIIGSNFMAEWEIYQKRQLQKKMQKGQRKMGGSTGADTAQHSMKAKNVALVYEQNMIMLQSIAEIQEKINDINPPKYYQQFKETSFKLDQAQNVISNLEKEIKKLRRENEQLKKMNSNAETLLDTSANSEDLRQLEIVEESEGDLQASKFKKIARSLMKHKKDTKPEASNK